MENKSFEEKRKTLEYLEEKSILYKLKRWEKNILKYLRNLFFKDETMTEHMKMMEEQKQYFNEEMKKENDNYEKESKKIEEEKKKDIFLIEENKNKIIEENNKKYNNLINYLESIRNDREKLIEFFNNYN